MSSRPEVYIPGHVWDSQNPSERDVLRGLANLHESRGKAHGDLSQDCILISPQDMKMLISQFYYADAQSQHTMPQSSEMSHTETHPILFNMDTVVVPAAPSSTLAFKPIVFRLCYPEVDRPRHNPFCDSFGMRPPEALLDAPQGISADIWTLACVLYELITGESLIDPFFQTLELGLTPEESHLIQIIEICGEFPRDVTKSGANGCKWFHDDGTIRLETTYYPVTLKDILHSRIEPSEITHTADLLRSMLRLRPQERAKARRSEKNSRESCFDVRIMWRSKGAGELYIYLPLTAENKKRLLTVPPLSLENPDFGFSVGRGAFFIPVGRWVSIAIRVKLNAVGLDDGEIELWIDGASVISITGLSFSNSEKSRLKGMHFQTFFGGNKPDWASPKDQRAWFADVTGVIVG
ncbi:polysaccharide lyase family 14 protein [Lentinula edodes]|uniref:Polysaccharide lyase family 14 protein n=1 Tax=Lentinula edodes TaxID=5353 RepID=A0A1Q3E8D7_LENED|nr:polysaccharide lyase family 14 protein [Lentinula edodes]